MPKTNRTKPAAAEIDIFDISLVRKLFPMNTRESILAARNVLHPPSSPLSTWETGRSEGQIPKGEHFLLLCEREGEAGALRDVPSVVYFFKREFGDTFAFAPSAIERILNTLGREEGEQLIASLVLPAAKSGRGAS